MSSIALRTNHTSKIILRQLIRPLASDATISIKPSDPIKASPEQLSRIEAAALGYAPQFFKARHPYELYSPHLIFINNIKGTRTEGLSKYLFQIGLIRTYYYLNFTRAKCEVLNLVKSHEESYVKIRWRIIASPGLVRLATFRTAEIWKDGISTLHVNNQGKIYTHICDNIETDQSTTAQKVKSTVVNRGGVAI